VGAVFDAGSEAGVSGDERQGKLQVSEGPTNLL
jgi:hypothetical protein